ncbi:phenylacetate-CoA oxygenase subunit PaaJ, partial [Microbacteriaceae bacterium K1510]|nr:phenylacetate-CoA oxygenase subunit PaaJ [Microbacteriaceae bacterium K1510]
MPEVSLVELGMIHQVKVVGGAVFIEVLPTFVGCPAIGMMKNAIVERVKAEEGVQEVTVTFVYQPAWSSDRISDEAREKLRHFGIASPPRNTRPGQPWEVKCPYCNSLYTQMENLFGPTACRSILYCKQCK